MPPRLLGGMIGRRCNYCLLLPFLPPSCRRQFPDLSRNNGFGHGKPVTHSFVVAPPLFFEYSVLAASYSPHLLR